MNALTVKPPIIQDRLENDFPSSPLVQQVNALQQGNLTNDEFAAAKQSYLTYLIADRVYNQYLHQQHGIRRRQYLQHIHQQTHGAVGGQGGVNTGGVSGGTSSGGTSSGGGPTGASGPQGASLGGGPPVSSSVGGGPPLASSGGGSGGTSSISTTSLLSSKQTSPLDTTRSGRPVSQRTKKP